MLNESPKKPKKPKDYSNPTKWELFWRVQGECWRRMVTPYLMYLFMSLLLLSVQAIVQDKNTVIEIVLGCLCIAGGAFYNGHLCYHYGILHYDAYLTGMVHRRNASLGIKSGGDHRPEREYSPWKGFYIGFLVGIPVIIMGIIAGSVEGVLGGYAKYALMMFAGWAIVPITWFGTRPEGGLIVSPYFSILMILLPILVSGIFYNVGAMVEKRRKERGEARDEAVASAGKKKK